MVKQSLGLAAVLLLSFPGCGCKKKITKPRRTDVLSQVAIPLAGDETAENIRSFFDTDVDEFVAVVPDEDIPSLAQAEQEREMKAAKEMRIDEFAWVDEEIEKEDAKTVYFQWDKYGVNEDQESIVKADIEKAKKELAKADEDGVEATVVIEGHACHAAGSSAYNLALSEKRAKVVADQFVAAGVPRDAIKVVGRGKEVPALVDGKAVTGGRQEQWLNRRVEMHLIQS